MKGFQKRGFVLVGVYHVDRCYGGPEEGGWWFDAWQHVHRGLSRSRDGRA